MKLIQLFAPSVLVAGLLASVCHAGDQWKTLTASEAAQHVGDTVTVHAVVAETAYLARSQGQPTFLNLDQPFPDNPLSVAIWGENRPKWNSAPDQWFKNKTVSVTGKVTLWHGKPQLVVTEPSQIEVVAQTAASQ